MKNSKFKSLFIVLFSILSFISCTNEPIDPAIDLTNPGGGTTPTTAEFKADFNGATYIASASEAVITNNTIQIIGAKPDGSAFGLQIQAATLGTYPAGQNLLVFNPSGSEYGYASFNTASPTENTGSITISNIDTVNKTISGTFTFKGYWTNTTETGVLPISFTNGIFNNIPYTTTTIPNPTTPDTFFAKVDGSEFVETTIDVAEVIASGFPNSYSIVGSKANGDNIGLRISKNLAVGTYPFNGPFNQDLTSNCVLNSLLYTSDTGSFTIISKTATRIKGTFNIVVNNFSTSQNKTITEGAFDVELP